MKRFRWKLQRVLDVEEQRREALRSELFHLAQAIAQVHEAILVRRSRLRAVLAEMATRPLAERIAAQAVFMPLAEVEEAAIGRLEARRTELQDRRDQTHRRFLEVRAMCRRLLRLREVAYRAYLQEAAREEQKALDETAHLAYARRRAWPGEGPESHGQRSVPAAVSGEPPSG